MHGEGSYPAIAVIVVGGILCGYLLRRTKLFDDRRRRIFSLVVLLGTYPLVGLLAVWRMPLQLRFWILPMIVACWLVLLIGASWAVSYVHRLAKRDRGVFICACALSNVGFTMGGLICYLAYGAEALGYTQIYLLLWNPVVVLIIFPLAHYFGPHSTEQSLVKVIWGGIWHIRSAVMAGVLTGIALSALGVPYPELADKCKVLQIVMVGGTFLAFSIIGLSLHLSQIRGYIRLYISHAAVRFVVSPLLALLMVGLFGLEISGLPGKVLLTLGIMPSAIYAVLIANIFDLNAKLASALFVVNTTVFLTIVLPILSIFVF